MAIVTQRMQSLPASNFLPEECISHHVTGHRASTKGRCDPIYNFNQHARNEFREGHKNSRASIISLSIPDVCLLRKAFAPTMAFGPITQWRLEPRLPLL